MGVCSTPYALSALLILVMMLAPSPNALGSDALCENTVSPDDLGYINSSTY